MPRIGRLEPAPGTFAPLATLDQRGPGRNTAVLRTYRAALARRESVAVDQVHIGHSLVEGEGATAVTKRWTDRVRDTLRSRFPTAGVAGGYGFVPVTANASTWSNTLCTPSGGSASGNFGPGRHAYFVNATGAQVVLNSITCTAVDVLYVQGGGGTFSTTVDGLANGDSRATTGTPVQIIKYRVPGISGPAAAHTVQVNFVSNNSIIVGFMVYNGDETSGIRVWNSGQGGLTSAQMLDPNNQHLADLATIAPSLVTLTALANDYKTQVALSTSRANLVTLVSQIRAKAPNASLVFIVEHALGGTGTPTIPWSSYAALYYDVAAVDGRIAVFDFYQRVGTSVPPTLPGIIHTDQQHYTDAGHLMHAEALAGFVAP